ncbi:MAG: class I SAM-dependent methyltransferase [Candidatus Hadarchaeota archaeon]
MICNEIQRKINKTGDLLDVGCGEGYLVNCLAKKLNRKIVGFDMSDSGFVKSHKWCKKFDTCDLIECVRGDAHKIDECFGEKTFDAVTLIYTLHHIDRPITALRKIREILRSYGKIIVLDYWFTERKRKSGCYKFTPNDVKNMLVRAGYKYLGADRVGKNSVLMVGEK